MTKYPEYVLRNQLAKISGVNSETIKKYTREGLLNGTMFDTESRKHRRYRKDLALKRLNEIKEMKKAGFSLDMIRVEFSKKYGAIISHNLKAKVEAIKRHSKK